MKRILEKERIEILQILSHLKSNRYLFHDSLTVNSNFLERNQSRLWKSRRYVKRSREREGEGERRIPGNLANWQIWGENVWLERVRMRADPSLIRFHSTTREKRTLDSFFLSSLSSADIYMWVRDGTWNADGWPFRAHGRWGKWGVGVREILPFRLGRAFRLINTVTAREETFRNVCTRFFLSFPFANGARFSQSRFSLG